jgi:hypothetical protein
MKIKSSSVAVILVWSCMASASAQQGAQASSPAALADATQTVTVTARRFHVEPQEFKDYEYTYGLSNGETVRFSRRVGRFYVAIKGQPAVEIFPTAPEQFATEGGAKLTFRDNGDMLTIDHYEALQVASGVSVASLPTAPK